MADDSDGAAAKNHPRQYPAATTASEDEEEEEEEEGEGFTFAAATRLGGGGVIGDGGIGTLYPVFGRPWSPPVQEVEEEDAGTATVRVPLRQLLLEERGSSSSSGQREDDDIAGSGDELYGVPAETYCMWSPGTSPTPSPSPSRWQKSGSTGSVLRWRQRLQVGRSHSDGKEKFVFLQAQDAAGSPGRRGRTAGESRGRGGVHGWSHYGRGGSGRGSPRSPSTFLPYKQDLLGLFANAGAFRRSYHPF